MLPVSNSTFFIEKLYIRRYTYKRQHYKAAYLNGPAS